MKYLLSILIICIVQSLFAQKKDYYYSVKVKDSFGITRCYLYSSSGKKIVDKGYDNIYINHWNWIVLTKNKKSTICDSTGKVLINNVQEARHIWTISDLIPIQKDGLWGYYDRRGNIKIPHKFNDATLFKNNKAAVELNSKFYFIDKSGKILPEKFIESEDYLFAILYTIDDLYHWDNLPQQVDEKNNKWGLIEVASGKVLIDYLYDGIYSLYDNKVIVKKDDKFGVVDLAGNIIIPMNFEKIILLRN